MKRYVLACATACVGGAVAFVACGIDESGLAGADGGMDALLNDAGGDVPDIGIPPTCSTIDASCLDASVPDGWSLVGIATNPSTPCPTPDFSPVNGLLTNPQLTSGSCSCAGCMTSGSYTCSGSAQVLEGSSGCSGFDASIAPYACVISTENGSSANASIVPPSPSGSAGCVNNPNGTGVVNTDPVGACLPNKCQSDYCGLGSQGFDTCIITDGMRTCPPGFTLKEIAGAATTSSCAGCPCNLGAPSCSGVIQVFSNGDCGDDAGMSASDYVDTIASDAGCVHTGNYASVVYLPNPPPMPTCSPTVAFDVTGDAGLLSPKTICCVN
jgi:hypothetical protein